MAEIARVRHARQISSSSLIFFRFLFSSFFLSFFFFQFPSAMPERSRYATAMQQKTFAATFRAAAALFFAISPSNAHATPHLPCRLPPQLEPTPEPAQPELFSASLLPHISFREFMCLSDTPCHAHAYIHASAIPSARKVRRSGYARARARARFTTVFFCARKRFMPAEFRLRASALILDIDLSDMP